MLQISSSWSSNACTSERRVSWENVAYDFVLISPAVSRMSRPSYLDGFGDGREVAVELLFCGMLLPGIVQYNSGFLCNFHLAFSLYAKSGHPYSRIDTIADMKKKCVLFYQKVDFYMIDNLSIVDHDFTIDVIFRGLEAAFEIGELVHLFQRTTI